MKALWRPYCLWLTLWSSFWSVTVGNGYYISRHRYAEVGWGYKAGRYYHILRCMRCDAVNQRTWHENPAEAGLMTAREQEKVRVKSDLQ